MQSVDISQKKTLLSGKDLMLLKSSIGWQHHIHWDIDPGPSSPPWSSPLP